MQLVSRLIAVIFTSTVLNAQCESVAEVLSSKGKFTVLLQALQAAGLDSAAALSGDANVTVFAPTDAAFTSLLEALGASAEDVLARDDLSSILLFHVAVGQLTGDRLAPGAVVQSLEGARLFAKLNENASAVFVGESQVLEANIPAGRAIIHSIDKVLLPPQRRLLEGGSAGWDEGQWSVVVDGVMGGKSTGNLDFSNGYVDFTGDISLDGGGFSSIRRDLSIDLSRHAGLMLEFDSHLYQAGKAPLGLHLQLGDSTSMFDFSAPFAVPFSSASERCRFFLPMKTFTHGSWNGRDCNNCELNYAAVNKLSVYVLFQSGPFEVRLYSIQAIEETLDAPLPTTPSVPLESNDITRLLEASISSGASLYDKGYEGICLEIYAVALRQILAASGPSFAIKALGCAGLRMTMEGTNEKKAWALRRAMDAILADLGGQTRKDNSQYPSYVQGDWLPAPGDFGEEHICAGLADLSSSGGDSTAFVFENPNSVERETGSVDGSSSLEGFLGPFEGMGITNWNDLGSSKNTSPQECARMCKDNVACRSFDYGARGKVAGECWLSTADREIAGDSYESWALYDYYEVKPSTTPSTSSTPATPDKMDDMKGSIKVKPSTTPSTSSTPATPDKMDDMKGSISNFLGPFEGMGITDWNDLENFKNLSPKECAQMCLKEPKCKSFDYGARGMLKGECWLSTANRAMVGAMYTRWELYDYYERSTDTGMPATAMSSEASEGGDDDDKDPLIYIVIGVCIIAGLAIGLAAACLYVRCKTRRIPKTTINAAVVVGHPVYGQGVNNVQAGLPVDGDCGASLEDPKICGA